MKPPGPDGAVTTSRMPALSVVVPTYDAGRFLAEAVESILTAPIAVEVVVVDDGSTDGSVEEIRRLPVTIVRRPHAGDAAARNAGVRASRGRFVTFLDSDDLSIPEGLAGLLRFLEATPSESVAGGYPGSLIDERRRTIAPVFARMARAHGSPLRLTSSFYVRDFFPVSCSLYVYRREVFDVVGPYDEGLRRCADCDFHFRVLKRFSIPVLRVAVFDRRLHGANASIAAAAGRPATFRPDAIAEARLVNERHGYAPRDIVPWENDYL
jgi:glycosyltransferase involved in cell wall biosynthesis